VCLEEERITELSVSKILEKRREERFQPAPPLLNLIDRGKERELLFEQLLPAAAAPEQQAILRDLQALDPLSLTPLEALIKITQWKQELSETAAAADDKKNSG
jgi:hypothetical protein